MFERRYFVLAPNFQGSTLLAKLLNLHPDITALGDTYPTNLFDQICGCGQRVSSCEFWQSIRHRVDAERYNDHPKLLPNCPRITCSGLMDRIDYKILPPGLLRKMIVRHEGASFASDYDAFLNAVYELSSPYAGRVFVDGVKSVSRVKAMIAVRSQVDGVVHLVRDPGDFVKSSQRQRGPGLISLVGSTLAWTAYHAAAGTLARHVPYTKVSYEELSEDTDRTLRRLFQFLGVAPMSVDRLRENASDVWHFMGNASLFAFDGRVQRSRHELTRLDRIVVRAFSARWLR